jgi:hypothetical protein
MRRPIYVPVESMGRCEREATPLLFAQYLVSLVDPVAVLWVQRDTIYKRFGLDLWGIERDANLYSGPGPIIAHPPCGPWGKYSSISKESRRHGIRAMELVHLYGGVVEQPAGSQLFKQYGRPMARVLWVDQHDYGHRAIKETDLYVYPPP